MSSPMMEQLELVDWTKAASALADAPIGRLVAIQGGGNNRMFRAEGEDGTVFALKIYLRDRSDPRDRIGQECDGLRFLWRRGLRKVPRFFAADTEMACALFEWVEGLPVARAGMRDIAAALDFIRVLKDSARHPEAEGLRPAAEACLSAEELACQVEKRLARLREVALFKPKLAHFLDTRFIPMFTRYLGAAQKGFAAAGLVWDQPLDRRYQTLSPSDFGFHNALRTADRGLVFLDFEYFGWDDPVKLIADFMLHPGMRLDPAQKQRFQRGAKAIFADDPAVPLRLQLLYPLFGLRWATIILNEFLPERWRRRAFAGGEGQDTAADRQLAKARRLLARLAPPTEGNPNDAHAKLFRHGTGPRGGAVHAAIGTTR